MGLIDMFNVFFKKHLRKFFAYYDSDKDIIIGSSDRNSVVYWHECGHKKQRQLIQIFSIIIMFLQLWVIACLVVADFQSAKISYVVWLSFLIFLELDAWGYAFYVWRKKRRKHGR
jgi:hypothetical protein